MQPRGKIIHYVEGNKNKNHCEHLTSKKCIVEDNRMTYLKCWGDANENAISTQNMKMNKRIQQNRNFKLLHCKDLLKDFFMLRVNYLRWKFRSIKRNGEYQTWYIYGLNIFSLCKNIEIIFDCSVKKWQILLWVNVDIQK